MSQEAKIRSNERLDASARLIAALCEPRAYAHPVNRIEVLETHISWVLLTGQYAYKIKKPVNLGFLDFSTLEQRLACCRDELRLNRRLAPHLYLDVIAITGSHQQPFLGGSGPAIEYAVKMVQFEQDLLASRLLKSGSLTPQHVEQLAATIAEFHAAAATTQCATQFGSPRAILSDAIQNFEQIESLPGAGEDHATLRELREWTIREFQERSSCFDFRWRGNYVRECHGDLHLGNIALIEGKLTPFDCIEFSAELRWIDIASESAFLVMDLIDRGRPDFAFLFLSTYLELTGDYGSLPVLRFYLAYRAMVRAKVHCLRAHQLTPDSAEYQRLLGAYRGYLALATRFTQPPRPALVIFHGLSGSGKSTVAQLLLQAINGIRIRSDVERKRMHGMDATERVAGGIDEGIYSCQTTDRVYRRLTQVAREITAAGYSVIVDAAFLKRWQRDLLHNLARELGVPFVIVAVWCPEESLKARIARRRRLESDASDADLGVLSHQIATQDTIATHEQDRVVTLDGSLPSEALRATAAWHDLIERLKPQAL